MRGFRRQVRHSGDVHRSQRRPRGVLERRTTTHPGVVALARRRINTREYPGLEKLGRRRWRQLPWGSGWRRIRPYNVASSFGATSFLRLITPGSSIMLSSGRRPKLLATVAVSPATSKSVPLVSTSVIISA